MAIAVASAVSALGTTAQVDATPPVEAPTRAGFVDASVQGRACVPGTTTADLSRMFDGEPGGLVGADYQRPYPLPDGRVLWLFQDGAVRTSSGAIEIVHNVALLQDGRCFDALYSGSRSRPGPFLYADLTERFARWFWPLDATMGADGLLYVFVAEMVERGVGYLTRVEPVATRAVAIDPSTIEDVGRTFPADSSPSNYGWSITSDDRWTYLYAQCFRQFGYDLYIFTRAFDRSCSANVTVARVPIGRPLDPLRYWDGHAWQADPARAVPVFPTDGRRINANQIEFTGSSFFSVNKEGDWWGDTVYFARAERATGPFVVYDRLTAPLKCGDCNSFFATWIPPAAVEHPPASFVFGISHNRWDGIVTALYRPTYLVVEAPPHLAGDDTLTVSTGAAGAVAVLLNVATTRSEAQGYVTAHSCDTDRPLASSLNFAAGVTTSNLVVADPSGDGSVCLYSRSTTDLVVDSFGAFGADDGFLPEVAPIRLADTRATRRLGAGETLRVTVPRAPASAVLNVTSVYPDADGYVTAHACDEPRPTTANLNHRAGVVTGNLALVRVGGSGEVCLYARTATDLVVDLAGGFTADGVAVALDAPTRLADTRESGGRPADRATFRVAAPDEVAAVVLNIAAVRADASGYVTAHACDEPRPTVASVNYPAGVVRNNLVVVRPGADGGVCLYVRSAVDLVVDLAGTFRDDGPLVSDGPTRLVDTRLAADR